mgnify:CR=1 FL=1
MATRGTSSTSREQATPRNLMGFKDGTANLKREDTKSIEEFVWVDEGDDARADWLAGGTGSPEALRAARRPVFR